MSHYLEDFCRPESRTLPPGAVTLEQLCTPKAGSAHVGRDGHVAEPEAARRPRYTLQQRLADLELQLAYAKLREGKL